MNPNYPDAVAVPGAPPIAGLVFRHFRGPDDYPEMVRIANEITVANGYEWNTTVEEMTDDYKPDERFDPAHDLLLAEVDGATIGYWRVIWWAVENGPLIYSMSHNLHPAWRGQGIGRAMLNWQENRARAIAGHDTSRPQHLQGYATEGNRYLAGLLEANGYQASRYFQLRVRPTLDNIPDFPLPAGLEVRPVRPEHYRAIWDADIDAFHDHWGVSEPEEEDYRRWLEHKVWFQPDLWQVAWDTATGQIAGQVRTYIDHAENEYFGRRRGYTEFISVRRPYRRRGLARALIALSLRAQRDAGMTESALNVDADSLTGATRIYEECGFQVEQTGTVYRKAL